MIKEYRVRTDKEFFDKFLELEARVRSMGALFQNEGFIVDQDELDIWLMEANNIADSVLRLKLEGYHKLEKLFED